jgi:hypothetical protein
MTYCVRAVIRKLSDAFLCVEADSPAEALRRAQHSVPDHFDVWHEQTEQVEIYDVREVTEEEPAGFRSDTNAAATRDLLSLEND